MRSASLAESLVRLVEGRDRAAVLVGDLIEIAQTRGRLWFALAVLRLLVSRLWRPVVGVIVVLFASLRLLAASEMALYGIHAQHRPPFMWTPFFNVVSGGATVLGGSALYSVIRYGIGDLYTRLAFAFACLCALVTFAWWLPGVPYVCAVLFLMLLVLSLLRRPRIWALFTAACTVITGFATFLTGMFALTWYQYAILHIRAMGSREYEQHPIFGWLVFAVYIADALVIALTCSLMHRRARKNALRRAQLDDALPDPHIP